MGTSHGDGAVDRRFAEAAAQGDQAAWDALVDRHIQDVWDTVRAHGLDEDDAANITVLAWHRLADRIRSGVQLLDVGAYVCDEADGEAALFISRRRRANVP